MALLRDLPAKTDEKRGRVLKISLYSVHLWMRGTDALKRGPVSTILSLPVHKRQADTRGNFSVRQSSPPPLVLSGSLSLYTAVTHGLLIIPLHEELAVRFSLRSRDDESRPPPTVKPPQLIVIKLLVRVARIK